MFSLVIIMIVMALLSGTGVQIRAARTENIPSPTNRRADSSPDSLSKVLAPSFILDRLKAADAALAEGFTAMGTTGDGRQWILTMYEGYCIIVEKLRSSPPTAKDIIDHNKRLALGGLGRGQAINVDSRPLRAFMVEQKITYFSPNCSASKDLVISYQLTSEEKVERLGKHASIDFVKPDAPTYSFPYRKIVWSLGRGFFKYIEDITSVTRLPNGNLQCEATVHDYDSKSKRWELVIDPRQDFLVMSATYFRNSKPYYQVDVKETSQLGDMFLSKKTNWRGPLGAKAQWACESVELQSDPELMETVRRELFGPYSTSADVHDETGSESIYNLKKIGETYRLAYIALSGRALPDIRELCPSLTPEQIKGKYVLFCFFDMEQRPSRNCILELSKKADELKLKDINIVAVHALKVEQDALNEWVKKNNITFPVGMVQGNEDKTRFTWGARSLPWLILTNKQHIVQAEGFGINQLDEKLTQLKEK